MKVLGSAIYCSLTQTITSFNRSVILILSLIWKEFSDACVIRSLTSFCTEKKIVAHGS